jgi:Skp family chaperone for outer membrane proteins
MRMNPILNAASILSAAVATITLTACGGPSASDAVPAASVSPADTTVDAAQAQTDLDAKLKAREDELAKREADLAIAAREQTSHAAKPSLRPRKPPRRRSPRP